ncbi:hypothetical protein AAF712_014173 [Marasmius tenuissimus]|uniref:Uncharacterized protein n=1 Tax=Marasmius tenuissimus TaxID=585030 RepID=A0ABR2ZBQ5_9AGAR|nr:hypothetical protein PM082_019979 [Marasmius tenuissimus]
MSKGSTNQQNDSQFFDYERFNQDQEFKTTWNTEPVGNSDSNDRHLLNLDRLLPIALPLLLSLADSSESMPPKQTEVPMPSCISWGVLASSAAPQNQDNLSGPVFSERLLNSSHEPSSSDEDSQSSEEDEAPPTAGLPLESLEETKARAFDGVNYNATTVKGLQPPCDRVVLHLFLKLHGQQARLVTITDLLIYTEALLIEEPPQGPGIFRKAGPVYTTSSSALLGAFFHGLRFQDGFGTVQRSDLEKELHQYWNCVHLATTFQMPESCDQALIYGGGFRIIGPGGMISLGQKPSDLAEFLPALNLQHGPTYEFLTRHRRQDCRARPSCHFVLALAVTPPVSDTAQKESSFSTSINYYPLPQGAASTPPDSTRINYYGLYGELNSALVSESRYPWYQPARGPVSQPQPPQPLTFVYEQPDGS